MYSKKIKELSKNIIDMHLSEEFKYDEGYDDLIDNMELYEEMFDYAYEIMNDYEELFSNFTLFKKYKNEVLSYLENHINDEKIGFNCQVILEYCNELIKENLILK